MLVDQLEIRRMMDILTCSGKKDNADYGQSGMAGNSSLKSVSGRLSYQEVMPTASDPISYHRPI